MNAQSSNHFRRVPRLSALVLLALTLCGCQPTLFHFINATSGDRGLAVHADLAFEPQHALQMDVYAPDAAHDLPVVVFFYGGTWQRGKRQWYRWLGETLARHGIVAAIPDYRKYPQVRMDGFMHDAAAATAFAQAHAQQWGGDPRRIFLMGHSAGGHIAALLATDAHWLHDAGFPMRDLAGFIGLAGPYDFLPLTDPDLIGMFGSQPAAQARSQPVNFVDGDEPPMLLLQGTDDSYVEPRNAKALAARMHARDESADVRLYPGIDHVHLLLSFSRPFRDRSPALRDTLDFIRAHPAAH